MTFIERELLYLPVLVAAFMRQGLPPEWGAGIARQESSFIATAVNNSAGDAKRGGSRGLCQMSLLTARGLGFLGPPEALLDPATNADLAARLCLEIALRLKTRNLTDVAAAYNSGKPLARAPKSTREVYVPRVTAFALAYRPRCAEIAARLSGQGAPPGKTPTVKIGPGGA